MDYKGITKNEADELLKCYGCNDIHETAHSSPSIILLRQFRKNFVIYLLLVAMAISFFVGKTATAYTLLAVILLVILIGFFQEYKAERAVDALRNMLMPLSSVIRDGKEREVPARELVPGDLVILRTGEKVPADCIVVEQKELRMNESLITGEAAEVRKEAVSDINAPKDEHKLYMGTFVVNGHCRAKVVHTGMNTQFGKIAATISQAEKELPLQDKVNHMVKYLVIGAIAVSVLTGVVMALRSMPLSFLNVVEILMVVLAISVAAFPEGFPMVLITTLALGAHRMAKKNAIVNRMSIIETLGETSVICTDKTGTITKGEMTAKSIFIGGTFIDVSGVGYVGKGDFTRDGVKIDPMADYALSLSLKAALLCNDARIELKERDEYPAVGSPTESALLVLGAKAGISAEDLQAVRIEEQPFSSERKCMSVLCMEEKGIFTYAKGAPEYLLQRCVSLQQGNAAVPLTDRMREELLDVNAQLNSKALRTIALAYKPAGSTHHREMDDSLVFLALVAMEDPPREEVKHSIELCRTGGIQVKMITGDHKETALAIAKEIGLDSQVLEGSQIDAMTDEELSKVAGEISIFARVKPEHKLRIVRALKKNGEIVTMTGDGINDAPALKEAHIGVAMGKNGTDVSRASADLVIKDDNFSTIVDAIKEGRTIFLNIQKFSSYQISINIAQIGLVFFSVLLGLPLPLVAIQILLMNIFSDEITAIALAFNPYAKDIMNMKPRKKSMLINKAIFSMMLMAAAVMIAGALGFFIYLYNYLGLDTATARTAVFVTMMFFAITNAFNFRSFRKPVHRRNPLANKYLVYSSLLSFLVTFLIIYTPLNTVFEMVPLSAHYWFLAFSISMLLVVIFDIIKLMNMKLDMLQVYS